MLEQMIDLDKCTGCKTCSNVCPKSAISYIEDEGGFWYPHIDAEKCVECGLCKDKCPILNGINSDNAKPEVYVAWSKDEYVRLNSTSGGLCYELSKYIIDNGGYVAGVEYSKDFKSAHYVLVNDIEGLGRITQTKYFQADPENVYIQIKKLLDKGKQVMFVGTPCYNAALKSYLGVEYKNLIQCEFICRGNPSPRLHKIHLEYQERIHESKVLFAQSKNKKKGWSCFGTYFKFKNGKEYYKDRWHHPMTIMFIGKNLNSRISCFECKYRTIPRVSDITVGDFWGIKGVTRKDLFNGCSVLMLNSNKGSQLFKTIKERIFFEERTIDDVTNGNISLLENVPRDSLRENFFIDINEMPFEEVIKKYVSPKDIGNPKWKGRLRKIKKIIEDIPRVSWGKFIYYNFFCHKVVRKKGKYLIPYRGSCITLKSGGKLYLDGNVQLNDCRIRGSKAETILIIEKGGVLRVKERLMLRYGNTMHVEAGAYLEIGNMGTNVNCNITCANAITIGYGVALGRDITIYDSNHHSTGNQVKSKPVVIGNHVWIGTGAIIMMGTKIGDGSIIGAHSFVAGKIRPNSVLSPEPARVISRKANWRL